MVKKMNKFIEKYNQYKQKYLIVEAEQDQLVLIRFLVTIDPIRNFTDDLIKQLFQFQPIVDTIVCDFDSEQYLQHCTVSIDHISDHGLYGYILRTNEQLIKQLFEQNKDVYYQFCKTSNINPSKRLKHTLPPTCKDYQLTDLQIQQLQTNIEQSFTKISKMIPNIVKKMIGEKQFGIPLNEVGKCKVIVLDQQLTFGIFTEPTTPNHFSFDIGNVYPTLPRDFSTNYKYVYQIDSVD